MHAAAARPPIDVVVPFAGSESALEALAERLRGLDLGDGDTLTIVDNRPAGSASGSTADAMIVRAPERQSSYFARNRGAARGANPWLVFIDADVQPPPDLLERYFDEAPAERAGVLAGGVVDGPPEAGAASSPAARFALLRASMSQANTLRAGPWGYAQTANCAVRREAFEAVGGFRDDVRSGGDADLCFRIRAAGWELEARELAAVTHSSRARLRKLMRQRARHGSGAAWLDREYPGAFPAARVPGLLKWTAQSFAGAILARLRGRRDDALVGVIEPLWVWAFELGRLFPNEVRER